MAIVRLQGELEKQNNIYYEFDPTCKPLGEGGMGKVYSGRKVSTITHETRAVAIKFMFADLPPSAIEKARREASIIIPNENLLEMMGFFSLEYEQPNGYKELRYHVVSELLIGVTLADLMQGVTTDVNGNQIPYAQQLYNMYNAKPEDFALTVIRKLLSGILALHDNGYIHRDIDPSNIMVTIDGKIKLIDFGISKRVDGLVTNDKFLTAAGQFVGKPQYAAPELILGDLKNQNKWTDIYAIGVLMFHLITGHLPFNGSLNEMMAAHLRKKLPLKEIKNKNLRRIIKKATDKKHERRYKTAAEMRAALDTGEPSIFPWKLILAAVASVVIVICAIVIILSMRKEDPVKPIISDNQQIELTLRDSLLTQPIAVEAYAVLESKAAKKDPEALYMMSRLYAISNGSFTLDNEYITMQTNLGKKIKKDPKKAHQLLEEVLSVKPDHYKALYDLGCNYYVGQEMTGSEPRSLKTAKILFDKAYKLADKADDAIYKNKIAAMLEKY